MSICALHGLVPHMSQATTSLWKTPGKGVWGKSRVKVPWNQTDKEVLVNQPDVVVVDREQKVDVAVIATLKRRSKRKLQYQEQLDWIQEYREIAQWNCSMILICILTLVSVSGSLLHFETRDFLVNYKMNNRCIRWITRVRMINKLFAQGLQGLRVSFNWSVLRLISLNVLLIYTCTSAKLKSSTKEIRGIPSLVKT